MNWANHFLVSFNLLLLMLHNKASIQEIIIFSIIFGLFLDLDHIVKRLLGGKEHHLRTWVQEPFGFVLIGIPTAVLLSRIYEPYYLLLVLVPYLSHILLDYLVIHEVSPFATFSKKIYHLGFIKPYPTPKWFLSRTELSENYLFVLNAFIYAILLKVFLQ